MLTITKQSDYGIILLSYIYKKNNQTSLSDLINETKLPQRFLARIAATLVKKGLLKSREGKNGGYQTTDKLKVFSLYNYLKKFSKKTCLSAVVEMKIINVSMMVFADTKAFLKIKLIEL